MTWHTIRSARTALGGYIRSASTVRGATAPRAADLFPCPPPYRLGTGSWWASLPASRRRSQRHCRRRARQSWVTLQCLALSHLALGRARVCPPRGCAGTALSPPQLEMVAFLEKLACSMCRLADVSSECGNSLAATGTLLGRLATKLVDLDMVPYARPRQRAAGAGPHAEVSPTAGTLRPLVASRASLPSAPVHFHPEPFLDGVTREAYENPAALLLPTEQWKPQPSLRARCSRTELFRLLRRWDRLGRLHLCEPHLVDPDDMSQIIMVAKSAELDRQIIDRRRRSAKEASLSRAVRHFPHAVLFGLIPPEA